jgi:DNA-binding XRE family transcriptional regulator
MNTPKRVSKSVLMFKANSYEKRMEEFSLHLMLCRRRLRINQTQFGSMIGLSQPLVSHLESGEWEPVPSLVFTIEKVLALAPGSLSCHLGYLPCRSSGE